MIEVTVNITKLRDCHGSLNIASEIIQLQRDSDQSFVPNKLI